ncbi:low temperature requirement protein A [Streptomyces griseiscabiei]|uniref:Low temperature requirement protein A n=1 Tax=Streptomyces griseiscabiei TaxID=2993540 RepID=A0ABU4LIW9_9ACTN|nr:low temperature requirement protein A [Streptomyces griseiscabiei]MBZ3907579.1 low temperature requirement protein A [Streptomyces griseiscabiei]MDX2915757.1 low temperature requirement protein A [Streptomyces griseiscabiei]
MTTHGERTRLTPTADGHKVTPAELFFDLVFVYAITQVTALMAADPTAPRLLGGMVVLALLWWCWCCFAWLGNVVRADSGGMFAVLVAVMAVVLVVSLTVPEVYDDAPGGLDAPLLFVACYGAVRVLHLVTYWLSAPDDTALRATLRRTALLSVLPPSTLLLAGAAFDGMTRILIWLAAVLIDYAGIFVTGKSGWRLASPAHFSERHGLIVIIALGESIVAIGVGVTGHPVSAPVVAAAALGLLAVAALWRLYFHGVAEPAEHRLAALTGDDRTVLARDTYTFLHLPLVAGVVITALGMKKTLQQVADTGHYGPAEPLHGMPAWALAGGAGLFLLGAAAILLRTTGRHAPVLLVGGVTCLAAGPLVALVPALAALAALAAVITAVLLLHGRPPRPATAG